MSITMSELLTKRKCSQCHTETKELWAYKMLSLCKECYEAIRPEEFDEKGNWNPKEGKLGIDF